MCDPFSDMGSMATASPGGDCLRTYPQQQQVDLHVVLQDRGMRKDLRGHLLCLLEFSCMHSAPQHVPNQMEQPATLEFWRWQLAPTNLAATNPPHAAIMQVGVGQRTRKEQQSSHDSKNDTQRLHSGCRLVRDARKRGVCTRNLPQTHDMRGEYI